MIGSGLQPFQGDFPGRQVYTVSRLNREVRDLLEGSFPTLWVEGEISNLARPRSGHLYFSLKDEDCQVRCAMFRPYNSHLDFLPANGQRVVAHARISLYPARGEFQLIVEYLEEGGDGILRRRFEALKQRLAAEGLFATANKKPLPLLPDRVGVITSPTGAALRDILSILKRRFPAVPVLLYPTEVQGNGAPEEIARMLTLASQQGVCDVLILARGGGSLEDLWAFNEEVVARAIHGSRIPVVTGIGHEIDFTIADFVADCRAATPSAAAELVVPDQKVWRQRLADLKSRLREHLCSRLREKRQALHWRRERLVHPRRRLLDSAQRVDEYTGRCQRALRNRLLAEKARLAGQTAGLHRHHPAAVLRDHQTRCQQLTRRLVRAGHQAAEARRLHLEGLRRILYSVSPTRTLERGYAIVTRHPEGQILSSTEGVRQGDQIQIKLAAGALLGTVDEVR